jgi:hypothetical protein
MEIEVLEGTEQKLFDLVAPLVLNPSVIRQNGGVAFKTTPQHRWIVSIAEDGTCDGFLPMQLKSNGYLINNYYVKDRDEKVLSVLLKETLDYARNQKAETLDIIAQIEDYSVVEKYGFKPEKIYINYTRYRKIL